MLLNLNLSHVVLVHQLVSNTILSLELLSVVISPHHYYLCQAMIWCSVSEHECEWAAKRKLVTSSVIWARVCDTIMALHRYQGGSITPKCPIPQNSSQNHFSSAPHPPRMTFPSHFSWRIWRPSIQSLIMSEHVKEPINHYWSQWSASKRST